ncbi:MAG: hypothetical protein ACOH1T_09395 [Microbacteriaceae bacterium]
MSNSDSPPTRPGTSGSSPNNQNNDLLRRLTALQAKTELFQEEIREAQIEIDALIALPAEGPVSASFDDRGVLVSLVIDKEGRDTIDAEQLIAEINYAVTRASQNPAPLFDPNADNLSDADVTAHASALFDQLFTSATTGLSSEPAIFKNDLKTVTITSVWGSLVAIDCSPSWINAASSASIEQEIIRVATLAAEEDDPLGRRKKEA